MAVNARTSFFQRSHSPTNFFHSTASSGVCSRGSYTFHAASARSKACAMYFRWFSTRSAARSGMRSVRLAALTAVWAS